MTSEQPLANDDSSQTLSELFDTGFRLHNELSSSSEDPRSSSFQSKVRRGILILEDGTRLVSALDIFSRNEGVEEVATAHLKYLLLPALLGSLQGRLTDEGDGAADTRAEVIRIQEAYYRDYLSRCQDYGLASGIEIPPEVKDEEEETAGETVSRPPDMAKMTVEREAAVRRFKRRKELEERLKILQEVAEREGSDEGAVREFHLATIERFVIECVDDLASFGSEKQLLRHMRLMRAGKAPVENKKKTRPLKPVIITRDAAQKEVFGMGYKNVPVMSIEEFYDQRVREGWFPNPENQSKALQDMPDPRAQEEEEAREKEEKEERDDEEELQRKRNWDEYRDTHRRGEGNRHNMG